MKTKQIELLKLLKKGFGFFNNKTNWSCYTDNSELFTFEWSDFSVLFNNGYISSYYNTYFKSDCNTKVWYAETTTLASDFLNSL